MLKKLIVFLFLTTTGAFAAVENEADTLVVLDNIATRETYSNILKTLEERNCKLTFKLADDAGLLLVKNGGYQYNNVIIIASSIKEFSGDLSSEKLTKFAEDGGNLLIADSNISAEALTEFALKCDSKLTDNGATNDKKLKRHKRNTIYIDREISSQIPINLPHFPAKGRPPTIQDVKQAVHHSADLPYDVINKMNIRNISSRGATLYLPDYNYNGDTYTGMKNVIFTRN